MHYTTIAMLAATLLAGAGLSLAAAPATDTGEATWRSEPASAAYLAAQGIVHKGRLVLATSVQDRDGAHILLLTRTAGPSPSAPRSGRVEFIGLDAAFYTKGSAGWRASWTLHDEVDCPGLDSAADFFARAVAITDLNGNGKVEVTLPYAMFCGGGVDPSTVKVVLREGPLKLAIRGQSLLQLAGQPPFGGERVLDPALKAPANVAYRRHLEQVWKAVSVDRRP